MTIRSNVARVLMVIAAATLFAGSCARVARAQMPPGSLQAACNILDIDNAANNPQPVGITAPASPPTHPLFGGKLYDSGRPVARGELVTILMGGTSADVGSRTVTLNGVAAPNLSLSPITDAIFPNVNWALTFQVPFDTEPYVANSIPYVNLQVSGCGGSTVVLIPMVPALYRNYWSGNAVVKDATTGMENDGEHMLRTFDGGVGYAAIYGYGFGLVQQPPPSGQPFPLALNPFDAGTKTAVLVDGANVPVLYAGAEPGSVGQYTVIVQVPTTAANATEPYRFGEVRVNGQLAGWFQIAVLPTAATGPLGHASGVR